MVQQRIAIIAGNWKMNYGPQEAATFVRQILPDLSHLLDRNSSVISILCPPAISLPAVRALLDQQAQPKIELGAQNMFYEEQGAFTGELSPKMVKELCSYVILGHSERRQYFAETNEQVNKKMVAAFKHALYPIVCVGENLAQYEANQTQEVLHTQIKQSLSGLIAQQASTLVIAYEPIWAIGTGRASNAENAGKVIHFIRELYADMYGAEAAEAVRLLYGGSVTSTNIQDFIAHPDIDGALVGGASIKPDFLEIVRNTLSA